MSALDRFYCNQTTIFLLRIVASIPGLSDMSGKKVNGKVSKEKEETPKEEKEKDS